MGASKIPMRFLPTLVTDAITEAGLVADASTGAVYWGDEATDGSYKIHIDSGKLVIEERVSGDWENRGTFG